MNFLKSIVCASVILAVSACGNNETAQTHLVQAEKLLTEKQNSSAIIALKNAIKLDGKNGKARFLLGRLYLASGDSFSAVKELERALEFKYDANKALPLLARAYMLTESDDDIFSLEQEAESLTQASKIQFLAYKTIAALRGDNEKLASETVAIALSISNVDRYSLLANAYLEFANKNTAHAAALVVRILTATPDNADALMLQGQVAIVEKNYSLAVASFEKYFELQPNSSKVQLFIADALLKNGQYSQAETIADTILAKIPNQAFLQYIKAMARFEVKDYKSASHFSNSSLASGFNSFSLKLVAGASAFYLQNYEQCHLFLKDVINYLPVDHAARKMLAVSQLQLGLIENISETLGDYSSSNKDNTQFLAVLSYELMERGAYEKAKELAKHVTDAPEVNAEQNARAGILKLMMNDPSGVENLELALQQNPELISAELALAFASIKTGDLTRADVIANKWLKQYPTKAGGYNLKATIAFVQNKLAQGQAALEQSLKLEPNNVYALTEMVKLAKHQKKPTKAMALTEEAIVAHPNNLKVLAQYFELHKNKEGLQPLIKAQQVNESNINYGTLLAEALIQLDKHKRANEILAGYQLNTKTPKRYWQLMLIANAKQKNAQEGVLILDKWRKNNPYHIEPVLLLVNYWAAKKQPDRALNILKRSFKQHPNSLILHLVKMQVLLNSNRSSEARRFLKELSSFDFNKDLRAGIEGRILLLERNFSAAIPKLKQQYFAKQSAQNAIFLAYGLEGNSQKQAAIDLLESYLLEYGLQPRVNLILANMYLSLDENKAIIKYEKLIKEQPNNIVALNNLSWLYMERNLFSQALIHAKKAYSLSAEIPNVVDTYAQVLLKSGKIAQALVKAEQAYKLSKPGDVDIALNFVETLLANYNKEQAKSILLKVTAKTKVQKARYQQFSGQLM
ncbi:MAG: PEP-CTERM system TPR-repeat protein PrsT [Colwellia sp.]|jgi:putative PEP-CTERM system TPR-repeat lipoprotein|nr:MAG: PEP-CTERM system TPR-repeat protein PrsT [Colwellia sp.]